MSAGPALTLLLLLWSAETPPERAPIPESIIAESITDIDAPAAGEIELEFNAGFMRSRRGGAYELQFGPEIEWLATDHLGTMLELFGAREAPAGGLSANRFGASAGLSWKVFHAFAHDFHLQAEIKGRYPADLSTVDPGESPLPLTIDLLSALRAGRWTFRTSLGGSVGKASAHLPVRGSVALLTGFDRPQRYGFWGFEATADGAKMAPFALALDFVPNLTLIGLPFRLGLVGAYSFGTPATVPSWGIFVRVFMESAREVEFDQRRPNPRE